MIGGMVPYKECHDRWVDYKITLHYISVSFISFIFNNKMSAKNLLQEKYHHLRDWLPKSERENPTYNTHQTNDGFVASVELQISNIPKNEKVLFRGGPSKKKVIAEQEAASRALVFLMDKDKESSAGTQHTQQDDEDEAAIVILNVSHQKNMKTNHSIKWVQMKPSQYSSDLHLGIDLSQRVERYEERDVDINIYDPENRIPIEAARALGVCVIRDEESLDRMMHMIE